MQANDYMNVVLHMLAHVSPLRDYFLREENYSHIIPPPGDQSYILGLRIFPLYSKYTLFQYRELENCFVNYGTLMPLRPM